uniref:Uncharacterized protein n=1 Tax=Aegilops tauschii subsp. strangulata TaxID=200361 RepID=A0A453C1C6_AEGTS
CLCLVVASSFVPDLPVSCCFGFAAVPGKYIGLDLVTSAHMSTDLPFFPSPPSPTHPRTVARRHLGGVLRHLGAME